MEVGLFCSVLVLATRLFSAVGAEAAPESQAPVGHEQPLGNHRTADISIDEVSKAISGEAFFKDYIHKAKLGAVFRGTAKEWPALSKWTDESLASEFGDQEVRIEGKVEFEDMGAIGSLGIGRDTFRSFVGDYESRDKRVVSELPAVMYGDVLVPGFLGCGRLGKSLVEVDVGLSNGSESTFLRRDQYNYLYCQVSGATNWILINADQAENVYAPPVARHEIAGISEINANSVDMIAFKRLADVPFASVQLSVGDCLFVRAGHFAQMRGSNQRNMGVSLLFSRVATLGDDGDEDTCFSDPPPSARPLDEFDVLWQWSGSGVLDMDRADDHYFKALFRDHMTGQPPAVNLTGVQQMLVTDIPIQMDAEAPETNTTADKLMSLLDGDKNGEITSEELDAVNRRIYRNVSFLIEGDSDLTNTYDFEYGLIDYRQLWDTLDDLLTAKMTESGVTKQAFLEKYTGASILGSEFYGRRLFEKFDTDGNGVISKDEVSPDIMEEHLAEYEMDYEGRGGLPVEGEDAEEEEGEGSGEEGSAGDLGDGEDDVNEDGNREQDSDDEGQERDDDEDDDDDDIDVTEARDRDERDEL